MPTPELPTLTEQAYLPLIHKEEAKFGVPEWLGDSLVWTESSDNPNAANGIHVGLLALDTTQAHYHHPGDNLLDPTTNLERGLPDIAAAVKAAQAKGMDVNKPSWSVAAYVDTHSGHPTFTGGWAGQEQAFKSGYAHVNPGTPLSDALGSTVYNNVPGAKPIGDAVNTLPSVGDAANATGAFFGSLTDWLGWMKDNPGYLVVVLLAFVVMLGAGLHLATNYTGVKLAV